MSDKTEEQTELQELIIKLFPPEKYGEDSNVEELFNRATDLEEELASLREQLEKEQEISQRLSDDLASALDTIEQKEDENRQLVKAIDKLCSWSGFCDFFPDEANELETIIQKHKKNLSIGLG